MEYDYIILKCFYDISYGFIFSSIAFASDHDIVCEIKNSLMVSCLLYGFFNYFARVTDNSLIVRDGVHLTSMMVL